MKKSVSTLILNGIALGLLLFTATRTIHLFQYLLPADQSYMAFVALVAFDGGLLGWMNYFLRGAKGPHQRGIAACLTVIDLIAVIISFSGDMFFVANAKGLVHIDPTWAITIIWSLVAIIAANLAAIVGCHMMSPENIEAQRLEHTNDKIMTQAFDLLDKQSDELAAEVAPILAQRMIDRARRVHMTGHNGQYGTMQPPATTVHPVPQLPQPVPPPTQPVQPPVQQPPSTPVQPLPVPEFYQDPLRDIQEYQQTIAHLQAELRKHQPNLPVRTEELMQPQHPLAQPPLDTTASQPGTNGNGHQK